ncbi:MAG: PQQ-binding-like beta-propeller repeat protein [Candidatus Bathyarchaeota archaeon]|nr:PQQ-binding-like beta-propeller repeat protein [Candidatus Bathyarchaeota archaeon]
MQKIITAAPNISSITPMRSRRVAATLLVVYLFLGVFVQLANSAAEPTSSNDDWSMFHHDPAHTGFTNSSAPTSIPKELWSTGPMAAYLTSPAIVNGIVYMTGYSLIAFDASTGEIVWQQREKGGSQLIVENGIVYTGLGAFNATNGAEIWGFQGGSIVAVTNGLYYTVTDNYSIISRDGYTGELLWEHGQLGCPSGIAVENGVLYFGTSSHFFALDAYNGSTVWETQKGIIQESSPAVSDGYVYFSGAFNGTTTDYNLFYCLDAFTGREVWCSKVYIGSSPAVAGGRVFVGGRDGQFFAFNATDGSKIWNYSVFSMPVGHGFESSPAVTSDAVYVGADDGYLYAFNASDGNKLWSYKVGDKQHLQCSPAIANGRIYMGSEENFLVVLEPCEVCFDVTFLEISLIILVVLIGIALAIISYNKLLKAN